MQPNKFRRLTRDHVHLGAVQPAEQLHADSPQPDVRAESIRHLNDALVADDTVEKHFHVRQALQLLVADDRA